MHVLFWKLSTKCLKIHSYNLLKMLKKKPLTIEMKPLPYYIIGMQKKNFGVSDPSLLFSKSGRPKISAERQI